jgi:hypothetical protein
MNKCWRAARRGQEAACDVFLKRYVAAITLNKAHYEKSIGGKFDSAIFPVPPGDIQVSGFLFNN